MKICFIVGSFPYMDCGIGDYTSMVAYELANKGNEVSVITSKKADKVFDNLNVYNIIEKFDNNSIRIIIDKLKDIKPDVIHLQYPSHGFNNRLVTDILLPKKIKKELKNVKLVETIHEFPEFIFRRRIVMPKNKYLLFDGTVFVEDYYIDRLKVKLGKKFEKVNTFVSSMGSNIPKSKLTSEEKQRMKSNLNLEDSVILSYFGFARPNKGIDNLLEAISKTKNKKIKLLYVGELKEENEYQKSLLDLIKSLNLQNRIIITGYIRDNSQVADYLALSDVCVLPYKDGVQKRYTSFLAACNQNIKIITTSLNGAKDENGVYYVQPNNPLQLSEKIDEVIVRKDDIDNKNVNDWKDIASEYLDIYNHMKV